MDIARSPGTLGALPLEIGRQIYHYHIVNNKEHAPQRIYERAKKPRAYWKPRCVLRGLNVASLQLCQEFKNVVKYYTAYHMELGAAELHSEDHMDELLCHDPVPIWASTLELTIDLRSFLSRRASEDENIDSTNPTYSWDVPKDWRGNAENNIQALLSLIEKFKTATSIRVLPLETQFASLMYYTTYEQWKTSWPDVATEEKWDAAYPFITMYKLLQSRLDELFLSRKMADLLNFQTPFQQEHVYNRYLGRFQSQQAYGDWKRHEWPDIKKRIDFNEANKQEILRLMREKKAAQQTG